jgi:RNA polymerase sigma-70 factor (ECF subfamily)
VNVAEARRESEAGSAAHPAELDELTLRRAQRGEPAACRALVERYQRPVFALLYRMMGAARRDRVEDLAQDTFLSVFRSLGQFAPLGPARLSSWILTIASRRAIDELRRAGEVATELGDHVLVSPARADERARRRDVAERVEQAVGALQPEYRAAFLLRELHGFEYAEIARALSIDLGTVKSRLARARAALRAALADLEEDGDVA